MNWKNVLYLLRVERKSGRLLRGIKATRYKENSFLAYWPYWVALLIGVPIGLLIGWALSSATLNGGLPGIPSVRDAILSVFVVLPTLVLIFSVVFTLLQQIQLAGLKATTQVMYWLPITWQEHTLASILANLLGFPFAFVIGLAGGTVAFSVFNGLILQAILTALTLFAAVFMGSAITEIFRILQTRFIGAVYKSSGRAAIWVRFIGSLLFFIIFYILYFYVTSGFTSFLRNLTSIQSAVWYVPFIWLALTISYLFNALFWQGILFLSLSALFIAGLYYLAVLLNKRFGLYEPPAITVQKGGIYAPKTGLLGRLGFSTVEAALIRKDLRAFTRRRELLSIYILPIIIIILPLINGGTSTQGNPVSLAVTFLLPGAAMATLLGEVLIGEEGQAVWRIYASPISAKNLVKSKYFFIILFSLIMIVASGFIGIILYHPTLRRIIVALIEAVFLVLAVGSISLEVGFKGADFSETRRARMVRQEWSLIGLIVSAIGGAAVVAPLIPSVLASFIPSLGPVSTLNLAISVIISVVISVIISSVFYRISIGSAEELLRKAEA